MTTNNLSIDQRKNLLPNQISDNRENIQLIWLDENITDSSDDISTMLMLTEMNPAAQIYTDFDRCLDLIKSIEHEQIFLIVSGSFIEQILSQINNHQSLVAIFIFRGNPQQYESLIDEHNEIIGIYTNQNDLFKALRMKINLIEKQRLAFNLFDQEQKSIKDLSKESASSIWNQMLIYVLKQIPQDQQSKKQMIDLCQDYYQNSKNELIKIEEFRNNYTSNQAIQWYTEDCFLYKLLNKSLRTEDIELLHTFRFFIIDLCTAIENQSQYLKDKEILTLYRGTQIPKNELKKLKENVGQIISTNGFLSTSRNLKISLKFARYNHWNNDFEGVLFEIRADPSLKSISFADIANQVVFEGEEEVLFNLNSLFKIHSIYFDSTLKLWKIQLNTTNEGSEKVQEYLTLAKRDMEYCSPIIYFGSLLLVELSQVDRAKKYFEMLLKSLPSDHDDIPSVYNNIGNVHLQKGEFNLALKYFEKAYEIRRKYLSPDHPHIASSLRNIGLIYKSKRNFDRALQYYQKALEIKEKTSPNDNLHKAMMIESIGLVYIDTNNLTDALNHLSRALEMYKHVLPKQHVNIATCLGNIGFVYKKKGDFSIALDYYHQQLKIEEECLPFDHSNLLIHLEWIVDMYKKMNKIEKGLKFCEEKVHYQKKKLGENHFSIARIWKIMGDSVMKNDPTKGMQYYEEALFILEKCAPSDRQAAGKCLKEMAGIYGGFDMLEDALRCYHKALHLYREILCSDHIEIANILSLIGFGHAQMNDLSKAYRYYNESLSIYRTKFGPEHKDVKRIEADITRLNNS